MGFDFKIARANLLSAPKEELLGSRADTYLSVVFVFKGWGVFGKVDIVVI
jgi:hypothetical protein